MADMYEHELSSYKREIEGLEQEGEKALRNIIKQDPSFNLTRFSLALSNRANLMVIGMCSLVELKLYEIAEEKEKQSSFKLSNLKGKGGLDKLKEFLAQIQAVDFRNLKSWSAFCHLYNIRNALVHTYGGAVRSADLSKVEKAVKALNIHQALCTSRIRFEKASLLKAHRVVTAVIDDINKQIT